MHKRMRRRAPCMGGKRRFAPGGRAARSHLRNQRPVTGIRGEVLLAVLVMAHEHGRVDHGREAQVGAMLAAQLAPRKLALQQVADIRAQHMPCPHSSGEVQPMVLAVTFVLPKVADWSVVIVRVAVWFG